MQKQKVIMKIESYSSEGGTLLLSIDGNKKPCGIMRKRMNKEILYE